MERRRCDPHSHERGAVLLLSVLVFTILGLTITASLLLFGTGQTSTSLAREQSGQAKGLADACVQEALKQMRNDASYTGIDDVTLGNGVCEYTVTDLGGENREIEAMGTVDTIVRKVFVSIDTINPSINVTSWQEVADF